MRSHSSGRDDPQVRASARALYQADDPPAISVLNIVALCLVSAQSDCVSQELSTLIDRRPQSPLDETLYSPSLSLVITRGQSQWSCHDASRSELTRPLSILHDAIDGVRQGMPLM